MTLTEYQKEYHEQDHILLKLTSAFPFFGEKIIIEDGKKRIEKNYHVADGMYSTYINYEMDKYGGLSAEISGIFTFEESLRCKMPVLIMNTGTEPLDIKLKSSQLSGSIEPNEVLGIYPENLAKQTQDQFDKQIMEKFTYKNGFISQAEINRLLSGN